MSYDATVGVTGAAGMPLLATTIERVIHAAPLDGSERLPCCGESAWPQASDLTRVLTTNHDQVTCRGR